ncbi:hypothetical protein [Inquilinus limosus]|uniref:Lipoprotein n=1 Tax=Inquilinus limosus MP06 TaxID=1398085 RepID=A0A0A0D8G6_9PROT|nr:hypothetical protein [Inquilinus limosus]KGM35001.1 hypothetical protein P409_07095 [Inquilinus limosus MP06]
MPTKGGDMGGWVRLAGALLLAGLSACAGPGRAPPPPQAKQPSVLDRAIAPAVKQLGGRIAPQGGIEFPVQPSR